MNDGTRTRDDQGHNLALYQLSYVHSDPYRTRTGDLCLDRAAL